MAEPKIRFKREDGISYPEWYKCCFADLIDGKISNGLFTDISKIGSGVKLINVTNLYDEPYINYETLDLLEVDKSKLDNNRVNPNDLLFTRSSVKASGIAHCNIYIGCDTDVVFDGHIMKASINSSKAIPMYAKYLMGSPNARNKTLQKAKTGAFTTIGQEDLGSVVLAVSPSLEEQQKIADFLSTVDEVISQSEAEVKNLEQQKKGAMQKIFSQEVRFKREDGTEFPEWEEKKIGAVFSRFATGLNPRDNFVLNAPNSSNYYVTIKNFEHGKLNLDENCDLVTDEAIKLINKRSNLKKDDILMSSIGRVGDCYLITETPMNWNINESVFVLRPDTEIVFPAYAFHTIHSDIVLNSILKQITGSTFKSIKMAQLKSTNMPIPCLEEQQKIADFLSAYDEAITYTKQELDKWKELKKGLLQQMFV